MAKRIKKREAIRKFIIIVLLTNKRGFLFKIRIALSKFLDKKQNGHKTFRGHLEITTGKHASFIKLARKTDIINATNSGNYKLNDYRISNEQSRDSITKFPTIRLKKKIFLELHTKIP